MTVFERSMASIAQSFAQVEERFVKVDERLDRHERLFEMIFSELQNIRAVTESTQKTLSSFMYAHGVHEEKIDDLTERVETLELKVL